MSKSLISLNELTLKHPKSNEQPISYGTAGFRDKWTILDSVAFRMGTLAAIRSKNKHGSAVGLMITASHNPEEDNGVKIIDPSGAMLDSIWEPFADELVNTDDAQLQEQVVNLLDKYCSTDESKVNGLVFIAYDTRSSSKSLALAAIDGVLAVKSDYKDFGLLTTPQLHYIVYNYNTNEIFGEASESGYFKKLSKAFVEANSEINLNPILCLDCANGVGAIKMKQLEQKINEAKLLQIKYFNSGDGVLNYHCGADYVKSKQCLPDNMLPEIGMRCASFDGDADRIVYYYLCPKTSKFILIDGDKIAILMMSYLKELFTLNKIEEQLDFCVVQTAYANGNSTKYINEILEVNSACVSTGVKHLDSRARKSDVSVYFEANGHGTACFSEKVMRLINGLPVETNVDAKHLKSFVDLINQTIGDAMSDLLVIETILNNRRWSIGNWNELYTDLPNRLLKVNVPDRDAIKTVDHERKCTEPIGLQEDIDKIVNSFGPLARSFVRPSGTENIVRVYAEAVTQKDTDQLAEKVADTVRRFLCK